MKVKSRIFAVICAACIFSTPVLAVNTKPSIAAAKKPAIVTMNGLIYKQLAPGTTTNTYWVMFQQDGTKKLFAAQLLGDTSLYLINTTKTKVKVTGATYTSKQWPYNFLSIQSLKGNIQKSEEAIDGTLKKIVDKSGKISYVIEKVYTKQIFKLVPKKNTNIDFNKYVNKSVMVIGVRANYNIYNPRNGGDFYVSLIQLAK